MWGKCGSPDLRRRPLIRPGEMQPIHALWARERNGFERASKHGRGRPNDVEAPVLVDPVIMKPLFMRRGRIRGPVVSFESIPS